MSLPTDGPAQLVLSSPAGIEATAAGTLHLQADAEVALDGGGHLSFSVARRWWATAAKGIRCIVRAGGMKLFASQGDLRVEAEAGAIEVSALEGIEIVSTDDTVYLIAPGRIVIEAGGSSSEWCAAGVCHRTPGAWTEHAATHAALGPECASPATAAA